MISLLTDTGGKYVIEVDKRRFEKLWASLSCFRIHAPKIKMAARTETIFSEKIRALPEIRTLLLMHDPERSGAIYRAPSHEIIFYVKKLIEIVPELDDFYAALIICLMHETAHALLSKRLRAPLKSFLHNSCTQIEAWGIRHWSAGPRLTFLKRLVKWSYSLKEWCANDLTDEFLNCYIKEFAAVLKVIEK